MCKRELVGCVCVTQGAQLMLCDDLGGVGGGVEGKFQKERTYVYLEPTRCSSETNTAWQSNYPSVQIRKKQDDLVHW